jgi:hypothetical protein
MEWPSCENAARRVGGVSGICPRWRWAGAGLAFVFVLPLAIAGGALGAEPSRPSSEQLKLGLELFTREWKPNDPRCHGGDGLGPVYNETSCVACHGQGGPGGAGPAGMNVEIISLIGGDIVDVRSKWNFDIHGVNFNIRTIWNPFMHGVNYSGVVQVDIPGIRIQGGVVKGAVDLHVSKDHALGHFKNGFVVSANGTTVKAGEFDLRTDPGDGGLVLSCAEGSIKAKSFTLKPDDDALMRIHPGLIAAPSTVIHHFGVDPGYAQWRSHLKDQLPSPRGMNRGGLTICGGRIVATERNSPPLFGLGLIDALPDDVLIATAEQEPPEVRGRVSRMKSGRIGRFGWKAQTTNLREFVLGACANELGLEVPEHGQSFSPLAPAVRAKALDLSQDECDALVVYVQSLPAPVSLESSYSDAIEAGRKSFETIGCADCHRPRLGNIEGIYSDLLIHDMGPELVSVTMTPYYGPTQKVDVPASSSLADGSEWRTPPLWGYRDSGPYLHDGRAENLHGVVRAHGGQASESSARFFGLPLERRTQIEQFLNSMAAPPSAPPKAGTEREDHAATHHSVLGPSSSSPPTRKPTTPARTVAKPRADQERLAASRLKMAQSLEKMDKPQGALVFYREIVQDEPDTVAARTAAARIKALTGDDADGKDQ